MLFGHNTDVKVGGTVYHVQTEDRGTETALIETTLYCGGRVLHRRTSSYRDLLPLQAPHEDVLRKRIDDQHRSVIEEMRSGALHLPAAAKESTSRGTIPTSDSPGNSTNPGHGALATPAVLTLELLNPKNWLAGKHANLQILVRQKQNGSAVPGARVVAHIDGAAAAAEISAQTGDDGQARLAFEMPPFSGGEPALVIQAKHIDATGHLKFQLRARTKVPTA